MGSGDYERRVMKLYIAGPMRGYPEFNFPAFDEAERRLKLAGFSVVSPASMDREFGFDPAVDGLKEFESLGGLEAALYRDFGAILECDGLALLRGWEKSEGARAEVFVAQTTGRDVYALVEDGEDGVKLLPIQRTGVELNQHVGNILLGKSTDKQTEESNVYKFPVKETPAGDSVYTDNTTGGMKGTKQAMFSLIPPRALWQLAERYGAGLKKYPARNWEKGYPWSLSVDALMRHLMQFWGGEDIDEETGGTHLSAVMWHAAALIEFMTTHPEMDDRSTTLNKGA